MNDKDHRRMTKIHNKIAQGKKLSWDDQDFLRSKAPHTRNRMETTYKIARTICELLDEADSKFGKEESIGALLSVTCSLLVGLANDGQGDAVNQAFYQMQKAFSENTSTELNYFLVEKKK